MSHLTKKSTVYFDMATYQALRLRSGASQVSVSALVDDAVKQLLREDYEDLAAFAQRKNEPEIGYEALLANLKRNGKLS